MNDQTQESRIRLVLLDGEALFRASLARLLTLEPGLEVVAECGSPAEALEILSAFPVDVVLLDFEHATEGGDGFMSVAHRSGYQGRFLIVTGSADATRAAVAIKLGASGIFLKSGAPDRLVKAITLVANGAAWLDQGIIQLLADQSAGRPSRLNDPKPGNLLPEREQKVLLGILGGLTNKKIGDNLGLSEGSVKASVQQLFYRAGVRTRSQLVRAALEGSLGTSKVPMRSTRNATAALAPTNSDQPCPPMQGNVSAHRGPNN